MTAPLLSLVSLAVFVAAPSAMAVTVYEYTGNPYTYIHDFTPPDGAFDPSMRVTVSFTVATPQAPDTRVNYRDSGDLLSYTLSNGRVTITQDDDPFLIIFYTSTDAAGAIVEWGIWAELGGIGAGGVFEAGQQDLSISTFFDVADQEDHSQIFECTQAGPGSCSVFEFDSASTEDQPGTWTLVPEPSTVVLAGFGLLALGALARRRRQQNG